jgi:hypothetical protein
MHPLFESSLEHRKRAAPVSRYFQSNGVRIFVWKFDASYPMGPARGATDFIHEFEQHAGIHLGRRSPSRLDAKMQHRKTLMRRAHEDGDADRPPSIRDREEGLHACNVAHPHPQPALLFKDLGYSISVYGVLNTHPYAMLVYVEEQQLLQGRPLLRGQSRGNFDGSAQ